MITVETYVFNAFQENTYLVYDESGECIIVDPGCYDPSEKEKLSSILDEKNLTLKKVINTHGHVDHLLGVKFLTEEFGVDFEYHEKDDVLVKGAVSHGEIYGFQLDTPPQPKTFLNEGDFISFGNSKLEVVHVPGHSPGHVAFVNRDENIALVGDILFSGSIGRTDLPGGDYDTLISNIKEKLLVLADETIVYSGHGPNTTIGKEKMSNPFLQ